MQMWKVLSETLATVMFNDIQNSPAEKWVETSSLAQARVSISAAADQKCWSDSAVYVLQTRELLFYMWCLRGPGRLLSLPTWISTEEKLPGNICQLYGTRLQEGTRLGSLTRALFTDRTSICANVTNQTKFNEQAQSLNTTEITIR